MGAPKQKTVEYIRQVHTVLEACGGRLSDAAILLKLSMPELKAIMDDHPELKSYVDGAVPPSSASTIAREPLVTRSAMEEREIVEAMKKAEDSMRDSLAAIGCKPGAVAQAIAFHQFGALHFKSMRHLIGGGIVKLYTDLFTEREELLADIATMKGGDNEREKLLREDLSRINDNIIKVYDRALEAWRIQAKLDAAKAQAKANASNVKAKPGFAPLVNVTPEKKKPKSPVLEAEEVPR